ncbi:MAG: hypothetical protein KDK36_22410, partial [Leptospiraceae bacterium]|nr:hypothetical protein [Leptospiraceae bacterium]
MAEIINIEKVPSDSRDLVEKGLSVALKKKKLGKADINFIQIEKFLSGGKTGAVVFVARYGISETSPKSSKAKKKPVKKTTKKSAKMGEEQQEPTFTFVRVLKIAPRTICLSENEGYVKTRETLLDIFSQVEYFPEDEFIHEDKSYDKPKKFGILLYQDVGAISAATDLSGIATFFTNKINKLSTKKDDVKKFSLELSLLMQKEIFLGLKKGLYGNLQRKNVFFKN